MHSSSVRGIAAPQTLQHLIVIPMVPTITERTIKDYFTLICQFRILYTEEPL